MGTPEQGREFVHKSGFKGELFVDPTGVPDMAGLPFDAPPKPKTGARAYALFNLPRNMNILGDGRTIEAAKRAAVEGVCAPRVVQSVVN